MIPRGIRNHNPGNIRHGDKWQGLSAEQTDSSFCVFDAPEYGYPWDNASRMRKAAGLE